MPDADEDHLRVALIQPGSSRYEQMSGSYFFDNCNQGGTACDTSLADRCKGLFLLNSLIFRKQKGERKWLILRKTKDFQH